MRDAEEVLGWDPFGLREPREPPVFLAGYDWQGLEPEYSAGLLEAISLTRPAPGAGQITPRALAELPPAPVFSRTPRVRQWAPDPRGELRRQGLGLLPEKLVVPRLIHSIWFGGPLG